MWPWNQHNRGIISECALPKSSFGNKDLFIAARTDTDYPTGNGKVAITGRYASKKDSFGIDAAYSIDENNTIYGSYGVTDEKLLGLGIETGFSLFGRQSVVDLNYNPVRDTGSVKVAARQGTIKLAGIFSFDQFKTDNIKHHSERYELETKLGDTESFKMVFDNKKKSAKIKLSRKLDPKNKLDAEYNHISTNSKAIVLTLKHAYSKMHTFSLGFNYGAKKFKAEWDCRTKNGPWTVTTNFPFNASPFSGDLAIKRRFDF